jgi:hypothetical protein
MIRSIFVLASLASGVAMAGPRVDEDNWMRRNQVPVPATPVQSFDQAVYDAFLQVEMRELGAQAASLGPFGMISAMQNVPQKVTKYSASFKAKNQYFLQNVQWGIIGQEVIKSLIIEYGVRSLDQTVTWAYESYEKYKAKLEAERAARDAAQRERVRKELSDGDISNGEYDFVGPHPSDNVAIEPQY